jgi:nucleotide-binding universal stress UspA family protein
MSNGEDRRPVIVVGYDGSPSSQAALDLAVRRVGGEGLLFIVYAYDLPPDFLASPNYERLLTESKDHGRKLLQALSIPAGTAHEIELIGGPPAQAITDVARVRRADEIVVGARGLGRVRALLGSVSHELLFIADRPVTVIPAAAVEESTSG